MKKRDRAVICRMAVTIIAFLLCSGIRVSAAGDEGERQQTAIIGDRQAEDAVYVYIKGLAGKETMIDSVQIGTERCNDIELITPEKGVRIRTLLLLDNSLSTGNNWGADAKDFLCELIDAHAENEEFKLLTYAQDMTVLSSYSTDYTALKNLVKGISYENQESYLRDVLYRLLEEVNESGDPCFTRFVIVADGADHQEIAYTENEVLEKLRESGVPVYSVGVETNNNNKELERFFSYARQSRGQYRSVKKGSDRSELLSVLDAEKQLLCIKIRPQRSLCDGSLKETRIIFSDGTELRTTLRMPFAGEAEVTEAPSPTLTPTPEATPQEKPEKEENREPEKEKEEDTDSSVFILLAVIGTVSVLVIIFLIVYLLKKRKKEIEERDRWTYLPEEESPEPEEERTLLMGRGGDPGRDADYAEGAFILLCDTEDPSRNFRIAIRDSITIGRKFPSDIVLDFDQAVSGRHCMITLRGGRYYLRDLGSSNKTYYNGDQVINETEIENGGILSVGRHRYRVTMEG